MNSLISSAVRIKSFERSSASAATTLAILMPAATSTASAFAILTAIGAWLLALTVKFFEEIVLADFIQVHAQLTA
jgi:hypothetical protein